MGLRAETHDRATYADLEAVPAHLVAEIIHGELRTLPRPAARHARSSSRLGVQIGGPFDLGLGGPGGWHILDKPELHFGPDTGQDILVPDLAGWRIERMPELPDTAFFTLAPDWVCEVLSPSTAADDRADKMPIYTRENVAYAWIIDPIAKTLEVFTLGSGRRWTVASVYRGDTRVRAEPFDAIELDLSTLWMK